MFQRSFKGVPRKMLGYFKEVSRVFEESFKGDSMKIAGCSNGVLCGFQWVFEKSLKSVSRMFQGIFKGVSRKIEWCSYLQC